VRVAHLAHPRPRDFPEGPFPDFDSALGLLIDFSQRRQNILFKDTQLAQLPGIFAVSTSHQSSRPQT
jgi:hypothetical protein